MERPGTRQGLDCDLSGALVVDFDPGVGVWPVCAAEGDEWEASVKKEANPLVIDPGATQHDPVGQTVFYDAADNTRFLCARLSREDG
jgi:hypothetical protein